jgi:hypothetical protein
LTATDPLLWHGWGTTPGLTREAGFTESALGMHRKYDFQDYGNAFEVATVLDLRRKILRDNRRTSANERE